MAVRVPFVITEPSVLLYTMRPTGSENGSKEPKVASGQLCVAMRFSCRQYPLLRQKSLGLQHAAEALREVSPLATLPSGKHHKIVIESAVADRTRKCCGQKLLKACLTGKHGSTGSDILRITWMFLGIATAIYHSWMQSFVDNSRLYAVQGSRIPREALKDVDCPSGQ
jgi:hypothetical protein